MPQTTPKPHLLEGRKILAPIDFSESGQAALAEADALAKATGGTLTLLHVQQVTELHVMDFAYQEPPERTARVRQAIESSVAALAETLQTPRDRVFIELPVGDALREIVERSSHHDLIIMGTHGRTGVSHFMLGSVTERVVRAARCSVLVVKRGEPSA
ncbi:MAG: universal stress protein [Myxococcales bacterium]|nr:universal stress protein [Myxococcales bacterium]